jgi:hypothetical protein
MNHPKIKHAIAGEPNIGNSIPWSPAGELRLREQIKIFWLTMWAFAILAWLALARMIAHHGDWHDAAWAGLFALLAVGNLFCVGWSRDRLGEEMRRLPNGDWFSGSGMLANKPRSTSTLTEWFTHPIGTKDFICPGCGTTLNFKKMAEWIPNHDPDQAADGTFPDIDPGGGRWVILCACGVGHYKLRA